MSTAPIDFHPPTEDAPAVLLPVTAGLFAERAVRFDTLAHDHSLGDWLTFLAHLTRAQQQALAALPELPLPDATTLDNARRHGMPPLDPTRRPDAWRDVLRRIAGELLPVVPAPAQVALIALQGSDDARLEMLADRLLTADGAPEDAAALPVVAAALQVVYTRLASQLPAGQVGKLDHPNVCPCCGSPAVASIVRLGTAINNLRYLHCSLCNSEWNIARATCTHCGGDKGVALHELAGGNGAVRAETCDECKSYLKIVHQEKDPHVDPVADDLATLALDLLVDEAGYQRAGPNLLLIGAHSTET